MDITDIYLANFDRMYYEYLEEMRLLENPQEHEREWNANQLYEAWAEALFDQEA